VQHDLLARLVAEHQELQREPAGAETAVGADERLGVAASTPSRSGS